MEHIIGNGSFARVCSVGPHAVVKIVPREWVRQAIRELAFLAACQRDHGDASVPPIVRATGMHWTTDCYIRLQRYDMNLIQFLIKYQVDQQMIKNIAHDILAGVAYLHALGIIHRDLKLDNILVDVAGPTVVLCDLGLSVPINEPRHAPRAQSQAYRAPEVDLVRSDYTEAIDMWSVGVYIV
jgi:serine/threonine protein kinase